MYQSMREVIDWIYISVSHVLLLFQLSSCLWVCVYSARRQDNWHMAVDIKDTAMHLLLLPWCLHLYPRSSPYIRWDCLVCFDKEHIKRIINNNDILYEKNWIIYLEKDKVFVYNNSNVMFNASSLVRIMRYPGQIAMVLFSVVYVIVELISHITFAYTHWWWHIIVSL